MADVPLLSGISGLSFDSPFLCLFLRPNPVALFSSCIVLFLLMVCSLDFTPENPPGLFFLVKRWGFIWLLLSS